MKRWMTFLPTAVLVIACSEDQEEPSGCRGSRGLPACTLRAIVAAMIAIVSGAPLTAQSRQPDPFPPRMFSGGYASSSAYTLAKGTGYLSAAYAGSDLVAQFDSEGGSSLPFIVGAAYGVSDRFTLGFGTGIWRLEADQGSSSETELFPYVAPRLSLLDSSGVTLSISGRIVKPMIEDFEGYFYEASLGFSTHTEQAALHISAGIFGYSEEFDDREVVLAIGGDYAVPIETNYLKLFGEFRVIGIDDGSQVLAAGVRFLGNTLGAEVGLARWLDDDDDLFGLFDYGIKPVVSVSYRF